MFVCLFFLVITVNNTHELGPLVEIRIPANESSLILKNLNYSTRYKFYFNAQTSVGSGSQITEEAVTIMDEGKMGMYKENPLSLKKYYQFYLKYYYCFLPLRKWSLIKNSQGLFQLYYILLKYFK